MCCGKNTEMQLLFESLSSYLVKMPVKEAHREQTKALPDQKSSFGNCTANIPWLCFHFASWSDAYDFTLIYHSNGLQSPHSALFRRRRNLSSNFVVLIRRFSPEALAWGACLWHLAHNSVSSDQIGQNNKWSLSGGQQRLAAFVSCVLWTGPEKQSLCLWWF